MDKPRSKHRSIAAAQRGYIIQRVLVDGWTARQAAETYDVEERRVAAWVRDFRQHGMAALRDADADAERAYRRLWRRWSATLQRACERWWGHAPSRETGDFIVLRRTVDDVRQRR